MGNLIHDMLNMPHDLYTISHITNPFLGYMLFGKPFIILLALVLWEVIEFITIEVLGSYSFMYFNEENPEAMIDVIIYDLFGGVIGIVLAMCTCLFLYNSIHSPYERFKKICPLPKCCPKDKKWWQNDWLSLFIYLFSVGPGPVSAVGWECNDAFVEWGICNGTWQTLPWGLFFMIFFDILVVLLLWRDIESRIVIIFTQFVLAAVSFQKVIPGSFLTIVCSLGFILIYLSMWGIGTYYKKYRRKRNDF